MAMDHAWIRPLFPDAPASGTQSRLSTISSRRSSIDDGDVAQSLTTEISTLSSQPVSQVKFDEGYRAFNLPRQQAQPQVSVETATVDEATADGYNGTHNGPFARYTSETSLNVGRLCNAVIIGRVSDIKMLLDQGISPTALHNGESPLHASARRGDVEVTRLLCDRRVDIEAKDKNGQTALGVAAAHGMCTVLKLLLEKGAGIEAKDKRGRTALIVGANGKLPVIELLLEKGAYIEAKIRIGYTALLKAVISGDTAIIKLLLEKGADVNARINDRATLLTMAQTRVEKHLVDLLLQYGATR